MRLSVLICEKLSLVFFVEKKVQVCVYGLNAPDYKCRERAWWFILYKKKG